MAYLRGTFCAGYRTTLRCKEINAFIKDFLRSTDSILELVHILYWVVKDYQNNEVTAEFYSTYYTPVLMTGFDSIELFTSKLYTQAVFRDVKKQINGVATLLLWGRNSISTMSVYTFSKMGKPSRVHKVLYDPNEQKIECECLMWNSKGIPCSHIFCVMKYEGLERVLQGLILSRWCKDVKDWRSTPLQRKEGNERRLLRYGTICAAISLVLKLRSEVAAEFVMAKDGTASFAEALQRRLYEKVERQLGLLPLSEIKDLVVAKTKGALKKGKESESCSQCEIGTKRRYCTNCGVVEHTKRTCTWDLGQGVGGTSDGASTRFGDCSSHDLSVVSHHSRRIIVKPLCLVSRVTSLLEPLG
ncbi:hypothetical protein AHAS_Ahas09G0066300 [Arachis hypogaea]